MEFQKVEQELSETKEKRNSLAIDYNDQISKIDGLNRELRESK